MPYVYAGENTVIVVHMHRVGVLIHYESIKSTCKKQALLLAALPVLLCNSVIWLDSSSYTIHSPQKDLKV